MFCKVRLGHLDSLLAVQAPPARTWSSAGRLPTFLRKCGPAVCVCALERIMEKLKEALQVSKLLNRLPRGESVLNCAVARLQHANTGITNNVVRHFSYTCSCYTETKMQPLLYHSESCSKPQTARLLPSLHSLQKHVLSKAPCDMGER